QPSAFCGLSGIKPTYGTGSRFGMIAYGSSLGQAGPIARHARDLPALLEPMVGFDPMDSTSLESCDGKANNAQRTRSNFDARPARELPHLMEPTAGSDPSPSPGL